MNSSNITCFWTQDDSPSLNHAAEYSIHKYNEGTFKFQLSYSVKFPDVKLHCTSSEWDRTEHNSPHYKQHNLT